MFVAKNSRARVLFYKKELSACAMALSALLLFLSLCSYNAHDSSWVFFSSRVMPITNWCGMFGANIAALAMYLFGTAAWLLVPLLAFGAYLLAMQRTLSQEWERVIAFILILIAVPALCSFYGIDFYHTRMPGGGFVGYATLSLLHQFLGRMGSVLCVYMLVYVSSVLLFQFSAISFALYVGRMTQRAALWCVHHHVVQRMIQRIKQGTYYIVTAPYLVVKKHFIERARSEAALGHIASVLHETEPRPTPSYYDMQSEAVTPQAVEAAQPESHASFSNEENYSAEQSEFTEHAVSFTAAEQDEKIDEDMPTQQAQARQYGLPNLNIFIGVEDKRNDQGYKHELEQRAQILQEKLERFGVFGTVTSIKSGPVVTLFEYQPHIDTKLSKILALEDDLALALQALSIRIIAPIPGRSVVGFEVSNKQREDVLFAHVVQSREYRDFNGALPLVLGEDTIGSNVVVDLTRMPHLLVAGSTGSGKSVALNTMLISLLCKHSPYDLKLILIDPKRLEFSSYADIAHLLFPIVTDPRRAAPVLRWAIKQMELRYEKMAQYGARNVFDYNALALQKGLEHFPYIVIVIDELSDLMLTIGRDIEDLITRITQMARAAGIHMIVATQRPSVDVITGLIKVNFPSRISFRVTSKGDSRTILDCGGADKLLGRGDMLFLDSTASILRRVHGAYVSEREIAQVVNHIRSQQHVEYLDITEELRHEESDLSHEDAALFKQVVEFLQSADEVSISLLQRQFRIGYNRSARIIDMLEAQGLIMPADGGKTRRVIR